MTKEKEKDKSLLEAAKNIESSVFGFKKYFDAIVNIAGGSVVSNVIKGVGVLLLTIGWFIVKRIIKKIRIDMAAQLTEQERQELQEYLDRINDRNDDSGIDDLDDDFQG